MIANWYAANIAMLQRIFGTVAYDDQCFTWVRIQNFILPPVYNQYSTSLLIRTPGYNLENHQGYQFYLNKVLRRTDGVSWTHYFDDHNYNDLADRNYARLSYHLRSFRPTMDLVSGDNLVDICQGVYNFLAQRQGV